MLSSSSSFARPALSNSCPFTKERLAGAIAIFNRELDALSSSELTKPKLASMAQSSIARVLPEISTIDGETALTLLAKGALYTRLETRLDSIFKNVLDCIGHARSRSERSMGLGSFYQIPPTAIIGATSSCIDKLLEAGEVATARGVGLDPEMFYPLADKELDCLSRGEAPEVYKLGIFAAATLRTAGLLSDDLPVAELFSRIQQASGETPPDELKELLLKRNFGELDFLHVFIRDNVVQLAKFASRAHVRLMAKYEPKEHAVQSALLKFGPSRRALDLGEVYGSGFEAATLLPLDLMRVGVSRLIQDFIPGREACFGTDFTEKTIQELIPAIRLAATGLSKLSFEEFSIKWQIISTPVPFYPLRLDTSAFKLLQSEGGGKFELQINSADAGTIHFDGQELRMGCPGMKHIRSIVDHMTSLSLRFVVPNLSRHIPEIKAANHMKIPGDWAGFVGSGMHF